MRKLLSVLLTATLALSCSAVTFSATESTATPDEAKKVTSIEMTKLPDKTEYVLDLVEAGWNYDDIEMDPDFDIEDEEAFLEALEQAEFFIDVDLTGSEITATYNDGSTEVVDNTLCTTSVADPANLRELFELILNMETEEDSEAFAALVAREYTINVEYSECATTFNVNVIADEYDYDDSTYVFESMTDSHGPVYVIEEELVEVDLNEGLDEEPYIIREVDFDTAGMTVTVRNKETGELETYSGDSIVLECYFFSEEEIAADEYISALAYVVTDSGEEVWFDYEFKLVHATTSNNTTPTTHPNATTAPTTATTESTPSNTKTDNGTVQTGTPSHAGLLTIVLLAGMTVAFIVYRKKVTE